MSCPASAFTDRASNYASFAFDFSTAEIQSRAASIRESGRQTQSPSRPARFFQARGNPAAWSVILKSRNRFSKKSLPSGSTGGSCSNKKPAFDRFSLNGSKASAPSPDHTAAACAGRCPACICRYGSTKRWRFPLRTGSHTASRRRSAPSRRHGNRVDCSSMSQNTCRYEGRAPP